MVTRSVLAGLGIALVAAGCSDEEPGPPLVGEVWLGLLAPIEGTAATFGAASKKGAELAAEEINAAGGVLGARLRIRTLDEEQGADKAAQQLIDDERIVGIVGPTKSSSAATAVPSIKARIVVIATGASNPGFTHADDADCFFRAVPADAYQGKVSASYAYEELGARRAALIHSDGPGGMGMKQAFGEAFKALGGEILADVPYPEQDSYETFDFAPLVQQAFAAAPELALLVGFDEDTERVVAAMKQDAGYQAVASTVQLMGWHLQGTALARRADASVVDGRFFGTLPGAPRNTERYARYAAAYAKAHGGAEPPPLSGASYDAVYLLAYALQKHGSATREDRTKIMQALRDVSGPPGTAVGPGEWAAGLAALEAGDIDYAGPSGPVDFDMHGDPGAAQYSIYKIAGGKLELVDDDYRGWMK